MHHLSPRRSFATAFLFASFALSFLLLSASCRTRACRDNFICEGFLCETLLCKTSCSADADCDTSRGYVCLRPPTCLLDDGKTPCPAPLCRCNPNDLSVTCHKNCFSDAQCDAKKDPKTGKQLFPKAQGFTCQTNITNPNRPGECTCPDGAPCKATESPKEAGSPDGSAPEETSPRD